MSSNRDSGDTSARAWHPNEPYQALPPLPPEASLETAEVLKACIDARAALAELKQASERIPDPRVLISSLPLLEAQASSEIENIVTTTDELFRHLDAGGDASAATREALRYREALLETYHSLHERPLGVRAAERICTRIRAREMAVRAVPGTAIGNTRTGEVIYTPPTGVALLRDLLSNWERFLHGRDDLDPLVRMAVAHYQFEAIHPFSDGNGRTGRILNSLFLVERGLLGAPVLYLSRYIIQHKTDYYERLLGVTRDGAWEAWLLYVLEAVAETSRWTLAKIDAIRRLSQATRAHVQTTLPKIYSAELVECLFERPYCRISHLVEASIVQRQAGARYLRKLVDAGVLAEQKQGRDKLFVNTRLLGLLSTERNEFASFD